MLPWLRVVQTLQGLASPGLPSQGCLCSILDRPQSWREMVSALALADNGLAVPDVESSFHFQGLQLRVTLPRH